MSEPIIASIITGSAMIIAAFINKKYSKENYTKIKKSLSLLLIILGSISMLIGIGFLIKTKFIENTQIKNKKTWSKYWITNKKSENGEIIGAVTIQMNSMNGISYNENLEKSILEFKNQNGLLKGEWKNERNYQKGSFEFKKEGDSKFNGYYNLNGIKKYWNGRRFEKFYTHFLNIESSPNNKIGFRSKYLTKKEIELINSGNNIFQTLLGELENGAEIKLIKETKGTYKIIAVLNNELRIGYIVKKYKGIKTLRKRE